MLMISPRRWIAMQLTSVSRPAERLKGSDYGNCSNILDHFETAQQKENTPKRLLRTEWISSKSNVHETLLEIKDLPARNLWHPEEGKSRRVSIQQNSNGFSHGLLTIFILCFFMFF